MSLNRNLAALFARNRARYELLHHPEAFTSQDIARLARVSGRTLAKVVVLRDRDGSHLMAVVPASERVSLPRLERVTGRRRLELLNEAALRALFPDCEPGAMPPFGDLYGMSMWVDPCLSQEPLFHFQPGNHHEIVRMTYDEFDRLAEPFTGDVCLHDCHEPAALRGG